MSRRSGGNLLVRAELFIGDCDSFFPEHSGGETHTKPTCGRLCVCFGGQHTKMTMMTISNALAISNALVCADDARPCRESVLFIMTNNQIIADYSLMFHSQYKICP